MATITGNGLLIGTPDNDLIIGGTGNDELHGRDGNDFLVGLDGNDQLYGEIGDDLLGGDASNLATAGDDLLDGGAGYDRVSYVNGFNGVTVDLRIQGTAQNTERGMDTLVGIEHATGTSFSDVLIGNDDHNILSGFDAGNDRLEGNDGNDLLIVGTGNHQIDGGAGIDFLSAAEAPGPVDVELFLQFTPFNTGQGTWTIARVEGVSGSNFNDLLAGDSGSNVLAGAGGSDLLIGGPGNDFLYGDGIVTWGNEILQTGLIAFHSSGYGSGGDRLIGGAGSDQLVGGAGSDTFAYQSVTDSSLLGADQIVDFSGRVVEGVNRGGRSSRVPGEGDRIDLSQIDANTLAAGNQPFTIVKQFSGTPGQIYSEHRGGDTFIFADVNGDSVADMQIVLLGALTPTGADFIL